MRPVRICDRHICALPLSWRQWKLPTECVGQVIRAYLAAIRRKLTLLAASKDQEPGSSFPHQGYLGSQAG